MEDDNGDVLYSDVKFIRNKTKANETDVSEAELTTYSEVNIRKARQNPEPSAVSQRVKPSPGSKVRVERVVLVIVCFLLIAALGVITCEYMKTKEMLRSEKVTLEADRANLTEECSRCDPGWKPYRGKCYYFSEDRLTWEESKQRCVNLSGNLVKIDSKKEQTFLVKKLRTAMKGLYDNFWIGLTDVAKEGECRWVDGSELDNDLRFRSSDQPDDWKGKNGEYLEGEDCVRMGEKSENGNETVVNCWFDKLCTVSHRMICEKAAKRRKRELKSVKHTGTSKADMSN